MAYPRVLVPDKNINECHEWALKRISKECNALWAASRGLALYNESGTNYEVQFSGKKRECAGCVYFDLDPTETLKLKEFPKPDYYDIPLRPPVALLDMKGSHANALVMPYSVMRTEAGLYPSSRFTHLVMVRDLPFNWFEFCGWMGKDEFEARKFLAPAAPEGDPKIAEIARLLIPRTWYVPISWLHPIEQLRCFRDPYIDAEGRLIHYCQYPLCGEEAPYGTGFFPRDGKLGLHRCAKHMRPSMFEVAR